MKANNPYKLTERISLDLRDSKGRFSTLSKAKYFTFLLDGDVYLFDEFQRVSDPISLKESILDTYFLYILSDISGSLDMDEPIEEPIDESIEEPIEELLLEDFEDLYEIDYFESVLENHLEVIPKERWNFKKMEIMTDVFANKVFNKDFVIIPAILPKNDVYESYVELRMTYNTIFKSYYPSINNRIVLNDLVEVEGEDDLINFIPLLDNLIYIHSVKSQKLLKNIQLDSLYAVVKYTIYDDQGNSDEKYISFKKQRNGGLLNSVDEYATDQALGITIDKQNHKSLLRYLQGFEWDQSDNPQFTGKKQYFTVDELILKFNFDGVVLPDIKSGDFESINSMRNKFLMDAFKKLRKLK